MSEVSPAFSDAVHFIITDDERNTLWGQRKDTGYCDGLFAFPAGRVETGETLFDALAREGREELGVRLQFNRQSSCCIEPVLTVQHTLMRDGKIKYFSQHFFEFSIHDFAGKIYNAEPDKCSALCWSRTPPQRVMPVSLHALACIAKKQRYSSFIDPA